MIPLAQQTTGRRRRRAAIPFASQNVLALDGSKPSTITQSVDGVTQWADSGPIGNHFFNDHASGSQPGYTNPNVTFDGGDHLHRDPDAGPTGLIPATGDWAMTSRFTPSATAEENLFAQYIADVNNGRLLLRVEAAQAELFLGNDASQPTVQVQGGTISSGTPYTISARRIGNTFVLRLDGTQVATRTDAGTRSILQEGNVIGARNGSAPSGYDGALTGFLNGSITRVGLWHGTFSDSDLQQIETWAGA